MANGPINLRGDLSIDVPAGRMREVRASLCRCGLTENEPFCDKACSRTGWSQAAAMTRIRLERKVQNTMTTQIETGEREVVLLENAHIRPMMGSMS